MFALYFDSIIYRLYKEKWKLEEDRELYSFQLPKMCPIKFNNDIRSELVVFKYPTHYRHMPVFQYNNAFVFYFSVLGSISQVMGIRYLYKKRSIKKFLFMTAISLVSFSEAYLGYTRVKDVYSIILKDGKTLSIKTFQDKDVNYELDLKDARIVNKETKDLLVLVDVNQAKARQFLFFFMEPSAGTVYNRELFDIVFIDGRYIKY